MKAIAILMMTGTLLATGAARAEAMLEDFSYPFEVKRLVLHSQRQSLSMAYMDVKPETPNGRTIVLLHGKNFCGATWERTIGALRDAGYRVVVPDQIGFCKSSKPEAYQFSLTQLAANTRRLLSELKIEKPVMIGHSMGGMLAARYALAYPRQLAGLVLVNPIGLEDWQAKGVPPATVDELYRSELKTDAERIKAYQMKVYYDGKWRPDYDRWVDMLAGMYAGADGARVAWNQALTSDMVFSQPVIHEFGRIRVPTTLMIGMRDKTAIGRDRAPPEVAAVLGNYPELAREAAQQIPNARLLSFSDLGHSPQVEDPERFNARLLEGLTLMGY
ncbi:alpha/beta hydrolase [Iodidimonas sp. SYSU 1G8]|uniref:alpha/beta fold hydrolase n=1 Tax=Iodidimonas sp. SYSU 1G8 TaxID=3133967 RepID=UPI0031FEB692